jgi:hypothetical protein
VSCQVSFPSRSRWLFFNVSRFIKLLYTSHVVFLSSYCVMHTRCVNVAVGCNDDTITPEEASDDDQQLDAIREESNTSTPDSGIMTGPSFIGQEEGSCNCKNTFAIIKVSAENKFQNKWLRCPEALSSSKFSIFYHLMSFDKSISPNFSGWFNDNTSSTVLWSHSFGYVSSQC